MKKLSSLRILFLLPFVVSCSNDLTQYKNRTPSFSMSDFFKGELCAKGVVRNSDQSVKRKFVANIVATSTNEQVMLDESFLFNDGEKQKRTWIFKKVGEYWVGNAGDVVGDAKGEVIGDTLHLTYQLKINLENDYIVVNMDDWLHLIDEYTLMGSTEISKWGFNVGRIDILINKFSCRT